MNVGDLLEDVAKEAGVEIGAMKDRVATYAAERAAHLATIPVTDPGYNRALRVERNNVAMQLGLDTTRTADAADARIVGFIQGLLLFLAGVKTA